VTTFLGVDHVGVGVGDVDEAIAFYGRHVGFDRVLFDYAGEVPGLEAVAGRTPEARVAMLESSGATPVGPGRVKLVQVLDGDGPPPVPAGQAWGEVGVCEICLHVRNVREVHDSLVAAGCASLMEPMSADASTGLTRHRVRRRPVGTKLR
jgi:catechol 2,3-dioxygenase-like lactoylglutathione lyase family enzyme